MPETQCMSYHIINLRCPKRRLQDSFIFAPTCGEMIQLDYCYASKMGWFNYQLP